MNAQWKTKQIKDPFNGTEKYAYITSKEDRSVYLVISRTVKDPDKNRFLPPSYVTLRLSDAVYNRNKSIGFVDGLPIITNNIMYTTHDIFKPAIFIRLEGDGLSFSSRYTTKWIFDYNNKDITGTGGHTTWFADDVLNLSQYQSYMGVGFQNRNTVLFDLAVSCDDYTNVTSSSRDNTGQRVTYYLDHLDYNPDNPKSQNNPLKIINDATSFIIRIISDNGEQTYTFNLSGSSKAIEYVRSATKEEKVSKKKAEKDAKEAIEKAKIKGCMDENYLEYNPNAERESKADCKTLKINGCMDSRAENYNKNATVDSICNYLTTYEIKNKYYFYNDIESLSLSNSSFVIGPESHSIKSNVHLENLNNRLEKLIKSCDFQSDIRINGRNSSQISRKELKDALLVLLFNNIQTPSYIIVRDNQGLFLGCLEMDMSSYSRDISFLNTYQSPEIIGYQIAEITGTKSTDDIKELLDLIESENDSCKIEIKNLYLDGDKLSFQLIQKSNSSNKLTITQYLGANMNGERIEYKNDKIVRKQAFKNNIAEGYYLVYYDSGEVKDSLFYVNGLQSGIQKRYYENRQLMAEAIYNAIGKKSGLYKSWHENGKLWNESRYNSNTKLHGQETIYYDNGQLKKTLNFNNGIVEGELKQYYKNGVVFEESSYKSGKKNGYCKKYYENGQLLSDANFVDDRIYKGRCNWYFSNGQVRYKLKFNKEGIGKGKEFSRDGKSSKPIEMRQEIKDKKYIWRLLKMY